MRGRRSWFSMTAPSHQRRLLLQWNVGALSVASPASQASAVSVQLYTRTDSSYCRLCVSLWQRCCSSICCWAAWHWILNQLWHVAHLSSEIDAGSIKVHPNCSMIHFFSGIKLNSSIILQICHINHASAEHRTFEPCVQRFSAIYQSYYPFPYADAEGKVFLRVLFPALGTPIYLFRLTWIIL